MVVCFKCSAATKDQLDSLMKLGKYRNYSEAISLALSNQLLLQSSGTNQAHVFEAESEPSPVMATITEPSQEKLSASSRRPLPQFDPSDLAHYGVPDIFTTCPVQPAGPIAPSPENTKSKDKEVPESEWIFGQYNKLLPAKVSCRALANLLVGTDGLDINTTAIKVANEAAYLGLHFVMLERRHHRGRDELLSTAFPGNSNPDKGRIRYANQFVAAINKQGQLSSLLVSLKLIGRLSDHGTKIALTQVGWDFAILRNPMLDDRDENPSSRFSEEETTFLLDHIVSTVPEERFAYTTILRALSKKHDTPEKLRIALAALEEGSGQWSPAFFANQRSGAISRMADLDLLVRDRDGVRVKYITTERGKKFLKVANNF